MTRFEKQKQIKVILKQLSMPKQEAIAPWTPQVVKSMVWAILINKEIGWLTIYRKKIYIERLLKLDSRRWTCMSPDDRFKNTYMKFIV